MRLCNPSPQTTPLTHAALFLGGLACRWWPARTARENRNLSIAVLLGFYVGFESLNNHETSVRRELTHLTTVSLEHFKLSVVSLLF